MSYEHIADPYERAARRRGWYPSFKDAAKLTRGDLRCQGGVWANNWEEACRMDNLAVEKEGA